MRSIYRALKHNIGREEGFLVTAREKSSRERVQGFLGDGIEEEFKRRSDL